MKCENCGRPVGDGLNFCSFCGTKINRNAKPEVIEEKVKCKKCSKEISKDLVFCPYCGTEQKTEAAQVVTEPVDVSKQTNDQPEELRPVKCARCGSEKVQVFSEYIELKEKKYFALFTFLYFFGFVLIVPGLIMMMIAIDNCVGGSGTPIPFFSAPLGIIGLILSVSAILDWISISVLKLFQPYDHETRVKAVCMDCGKIWIIQNVVQEKEFSSDENKQ
ncbi:MAG: zinc ribbon domain-containing protein [Clostridia bacterium]|nr:zinc ribbon domain-containing protein [Clostridia bacterium]